MTQAEVPLLVQQARALLAGLEARRHDPGLSADLLNLAAACHTSMLAISANDRPAAVQLAIAGADLVQELQALGEANALLLDWVPVGAIAAQGWLSDCVKYLSQLVSIR